MNLLSAWLAATWSASLSAAFTAPMSNDQISFARLERPPFPLTCEAIEHPDGAELEGTVIVRITVDSSGFVAEARVVRGLFPDYDAQALDIARRQPYAPGVHGNRAVWTRNVIQRVIFLRR